METSPVLALTTMRLEPAGRVGRSLPPVFAVGIGAMAGVRPMMALAVVSYAVKRGWIRPGRSPLVSQISGHLYKRIAEFALSEFIAEKLPVTRSRITAVALGSRIASGAVCGAAIHSSMQRPARQGAILGAVGALTGTITAKQIRERAKREIPDFAIALCEDAFVLAGAFVVSLGARAE